jgi:hypothetical protein
MMNLDQGDSGMFSTQGRKQQFHMSSDGMFGTAPNDKTMRMALIEDSSEQDMTSQSYQAQQARQQVIDSPAHRAALKAIRDGKIKDITDPLTDPIPGVPTLYDTGGTGSATSGTNAAGSMGGMQMGQKSLKDKNTQAKIFMDMTKDASRMAGKIVQLITSGSGGGGGGGSGGSGGSKAGSSGGSSGSSQQQGTTLAEASSDSKFYCGGSPKKGKFALIVTVKGPTINVPGRIG